MAFNPFRAFRKHQKVMFAGLIGVSMVTFILCSGLSGGGDFGGWIQQVAQTFGARNRGAGTVYGQNYSPPELNQVRQMRLAANRFMKQAILAGQNGLLGDLASPRGKSHAVGMRLAQAIREAQLAQIPLEWRRQIPPLDENQVGMLLANARPEYRFEVERIRAELTQEGKKDDAAAIGQYATMLDQQSRLHHTKELYFGGTTTQQDLFDFLIWKHQADRLGIKLTPQQLQAEFMRETLHRVSDSEAKRLEAAVLGEYSNLPSATLHAALADEFRVRLAKIALGYEPEYRTGPITPYEYWRYFQEQRVENTVAVLPIPVRDLQGELEKDWVKDVDKLGPPPAQDLVELFNKYKNQEFNPKSREPGFKQPRRVQVEWIQARADSEYFRQQAARSATLLETLAPAAFNARLLVEYQQYLEQLPTWSAPAFRDFYRLHDSSVLGPRAAAANVGLAAMAGQGASILPVVSASYTTAVGLERDSRLRIGTAWLLAGSAPPPIGLGLAAAPIPAPIPLEAYRRRMRDQIRDDLAHRLVTGTLEALKVEVLKKKKLPEDAGKKYELTRGATQEPLNRFQLADAKGLEPFRDAFRKKNFYTPEAERELNEKFAQQLLEPTATFDPRLWPTATFPGERPGEVQFLYWINAEKPAYVPASLDEVKPQVVRAWRLQKAHKLAQVEAERLRAQAEAAQGDAERTLKEGSAHAQKSALFVLGGPDATMPPVARWTKRRIPIPGHIPEYEPYKLPEGRIRYTGAKYPEQIENKLLGLKERGASTVFWDEEENTVFVATLLNRTQPDVNEFVSFYKAPYLAPGTGAFERSNQDKYRNGLMQRLRADAGLWVNPEFKQSEQGNLEE
jgi:hypothetical protein